jgi:ABC-type uncharacterized transport system substrate-binding protein
MAGVGMMGLGVVFAITLALSSGLFSPGAAAAQQAAKVARIGLLATSSGANPAREAFIQGLRDLGYVEGRNIVIEYRYSEGHDDRFPAFAAELVALKVDIIVAPGTPAALAAKQATRTLPIVFVAVADPVSSGLVTSLARPDGNLTGSSLLFPELVGKCLELLKQAVPKATRIAVLRQHGPIPERSGNKSLKEAEAAARALGIRLQSVEVRRPADLERAFAEINTARADGLTVFGGTMLIAQRRRLVDLVAKLGCRPSIT